MQVALASSRSPDAAANEDFVAATASVVSVVVVLDGASAPPGVETGCVHGTLWFVRRLGAALLEVLSTQTEQAPVDNLAQAIVNVSALRINACDLGHPGNPSAAIAILREQRETIEFLLLGDTTVLLDESAGVRVVTDDWLEKVAGGEQAAHQQATGSATKGSRPAAVAGPTGCGRQDGFWRVSSNPDAADSAVTGTVRRRGLGRAAVLSKGATRLADRFGLMGWPSFLDLLDKGGPEALIDRLRDAERSDPGGQRWPRGVAHDDATAVVCHFRDRARTGRGGHR